MKVNNCSCGGEAKPYRQDFPTAIRVFIMCTKCEKEGGNQSLRHEAFIDIWTEKAIKEWNGLTGKAG